LSKSGADPKGAGKAESSPGGSEEVGPTPERSGEAERAAEGSGELRTLSVGPDWAVAAPIIILGGLRPISFNSCLMGTLILVPDSSP
jgi:hypothetical protein